MQLGSCRTKFYIFMDIWAQYQKKKIYVYSARTEAKELKEWGYQAKHLHTEGSFAMEELIHDCFEASDIRCFVQPQALAEILRRMSGCSYHRLLMQGFTKAELEEAGIKDSDMGSPPGTVSLFASNPFGGTTGGKNSIFIGYAAKKS